MRKCQQKLLKNWGYRYVRTRVIAFPKIGKVAPQATDECAPIPRAIRLRTLISRLRRQLLHLGEAFKVRRLLVQIKI